MVGARRSGGAGCKGSKNQTKNQRSREKKNTEPQDGHVKRMPLISSLHRSGFVQAATAAPRGGVQQTVSEAIFHSKTNYDEDDERTTTWTQRHQAGNENDLRQQGREENTRTIQIFLNFISSEVTRSLTDTTHLGPREMTAVA